MPSEGKAQVHQVFYFYLQRQEELVIVTAYDILFGQVCHLPKPLKWSNWFNSLCVFTYLILVNCKFKYSCYKMFILWVLDWIKYLSYQVIIYVNCSSSTCHSISSVMLFLLFFLLKKFWHEMTFLGNCSFWISWAVNYDTQRHSE